MRQRVRSLAAKLIALGVVCALGLECSLYFSPPGHLLHAIGIFGVLCLLEVFGLYLLTFLYPRICPGWLGVPGRLLLNRRQAPIVLCAVAMFLCSLLCVRSYQVRDWLKIRVFQDRGLVVSSGQGVLAISCGGIWCYRRNRPYFDDPEWRRIWIGESRVWIESEIVTTWMKRYNCPTLWTFDFEVRREGPKPRKPTHTIVTVVFPHWVPFVLLGIGPALAMFRGCRRYRRGLANRCLGCGYDLTGNVSGRCPECGLDSARGPADKSVSAKSDP